VRSGIETREAFVGVPDRMLVYRWAFTQPCSTVRVMLEPPQSVWSEDGSSLILIGQCLSTIHGDANHAEPMLHGSDLDKMIGDRAFMRVCWHWSEGLVFELKSNRSRVAGRMAFGSAGFGTHPGTRMAGKATVA
jgi:hypothetical protein